MTFRQVKWIMMGILFMWSLTGCGTPMSDDSNGGAGAGDTAPEKGGPVAFKNETEKNLPASVQAEKEQLLQQSPQKPKHIEVEHQGTLYAIITTPQKPTGGYSIRVNQVERQGNQVTIHAEEIAPAEDSMVTQVLTTPVAVISFQTDDDPEVQLKMEQKESEETKASPGAESDQQENASLSVRTESSRQLPAEVKEKAESIRTKGGETTVHHDGRQFVIIALGERRTGGYQVKVEEIEQRGNEVHVYAREEGPEPGMMVIQAITYPLAVVSFETKEVQAVNVHLQQSDSTGRDEV